MYFFQICFHCQEYTFCAPFLRKKKLCSFFPSVILLLLLFFLIWIILNCDSKTGERITFKAEIKVRD